MDLAGLAVTADARGEAAPRVAGGTVVVAALLYLIIGLGWSWLWFSHVAPMAPRRLPAVRLLRHAIPWSFWLIFAYSVMSPARRLKQRPIRAAALTALSSTLIGCGALILVAQALWPRRTLGCVRRGPQSFCPGPLPLTMNGWYPLRDLAVLGACVVVLAIPLAWMASGGWRVHGGGGSAASGE
jgi:hypothetical protein